MEFCGAVLVSEFAGAAYGGGGAVHLLNGSSPFHSGGRVVSNNVAEANAFGGAGDKIYSLNPLNADGGVSQGVNSGLYIGNLAGAFTAVGDTAIGVGRLKICYRRWASGL